MGFLTLDELDRIAKELGDRRRPDTRTCWVLISMARAALYRGAYPHPPVRPATLETRKNQAPTVPYNGEAPVAPGSNTSARAARKWTVERITAAHRRLMLILLSCNPVVKAATPYGAFVGGMTRGELTFAAQMKENTVNGRIAELIAGKLVAEHPDATRNGRAVLHLTPQGMEKARSYAPPVPSEAGPRIRAVR